MINFVFYCFQLNNVTNTTDQMMHLCNSTCALTTELRRHFKYVLKNNDRKRVYNVNHPGILPF